jgi:predicted O-methyltransferase YrrM
MRFDEEWFGPASQKAVAGLVARTRALPGEVVEIGCWQGRSTIAIARAAWPKIVHAVDTWDGSPGEISADIADGRDVFAEFTENIDELTRGNVEVHRMGWRDYFAADHGPVRFCHIDAEHTYREVYDNIQAVLPLMVPGGILCGDDAHHPPVIQAVDELLGKTDRQASLWIYEVA